MSRRGVVSLDGVRIGIIEEIPTGTRFTYDDPEGVEPPLSLSMPRRGRPYEAASLLPFFANLLPEGWLLEIAVQRLRISRDDAFGLMLATCADTAGAVEIHEEPT